MEKKNLDWANLSFSYIKTDKRFVANYKNGAWEDGQLIDDDKVVITECAGVLQYSQSCFEGLKAYTTEDGHVVCFRPDLNAQRMEDSCRRLEMPVFPAARFVDAVVETVRHAGASPCPPMVIGVGIGGNMETACLCAKKACARDADSHNPDPRYAKLEDELLELVNRLGTGPAGLGGSVTAFKVNVEFCATHIASLPVAVNINCNAARHAEAVL